jgi:hypothetical protein
MSESSVNSYDESSIELYRKLVYPDSSELEQVSKLLSDYIKNNSSGKETIYILDIGIGGGWISIPVLKKLLNDSEFSSQLFFIGIDTCPNMISACQNTIKQEFKDSIIIESETDSVEQKIFEVKNANTPPLQIKLIESDFLKFNNLEKSIDFCFAFFVFHHMRDKWKMGVKKSINFLKNDGTIFIPELHGDHAAWSVSFDRIINFEGLLSDEKRLKYLMFIRHFLNECQEYGWYNYLPISASNSSPIIDYLKDVNFVSCDSIHFDYHIHCTLDDWLHCGGSEYSKRVFSVFPNNLDENAKIEFKSKLKNYANKTLEIKLTDKIAPIDRLCINILKLNKEKTEPSNGLDKYYKKDAIKIFSELYKGEDDTYKLWKRDLATMLYFQVIREPNIIFFLHWDVVHETWFKKVPVVLKEPYLAKYLFYIYISDHFLKTFKISDLIYRELPEKIQIKIVHSANNENSVELKLNREGTAHSITITIPANILNQDDKELTLLQSAFEQKISTLVNNNRFVIESIINYNLNFFDNNQYFNNRKFLEEILDRHKIDLSIFNEDLTEQISQKLQKTFQILSKFNDNKKWEIEQEKRENLVKALALSCLANSKQIIHYPSKDSVDVKHGGKSKNEIAAGGLILYYNEETKVNEELLIELLNLRNRSSYITQYTQRALQDIRKHANKSAITAIMSRNMSHNLGSHVLSYVKSDLTHFETLLDEKEKNQAKQQRYGKVEALTEVEKELAYRNGTVRLLNYLQERQDFIAALSSFEDFTFMPIDLHHALNNFLFKDLENEGYNLLLSNLAYSEGYSLKSLKVYFREYEITGQNSEGKKLYENIKLSVPYGIMGRQAIYSILENFIRNSAKHKTKTGDLKIRLNTPHLKYDDETTSISLIDDYIDAPFVKKDGTVELNDRGTYVFKVEWEKYYYELSGEKKYLSKRFFQADRTGIDKYYDENTEFTDSEKILSEKITNTDNLDEYTYPKYFLTSVQDGSKIPLNFDLEKDCFRTSEKDVETSQYILDYDPEEYYKVTLSNNLNDYSAAAPNLKKGLHDDFIDRRTGKLKREYRGIKEIKISAAWLRGVDLAEVNDQTFFPPILDIRYSSPELGRSNSKESLVHENIEYVFYFLKSKEVLILLSEKSYKKISEGNENISAFKKKLHQYGIDILSWDKFSEDAEYKHRLNVIDQELWEGSEKEKITRSINLRQLELAFDRIKEILENEGGDPKKIIDKFWLERIKFFHKELELENLGQDQSSAQQIAAEFSIDLEAEKIYLLDEKAQYTSESNSNFLLYDTKSINENQIKQITSEAKILFRIHNDNKKDFNEFKENYPALFHRLLYLEGISDGNSTAYLVRTTPKTEAFKYQLLESCLTRVLFIDERLWLQYSDKTIEQVHKQKGEQYFFAFNKELEKIKSLAEDIWIEKVANLIDNSNESKKKYRNLYKYRSFPSVLRDRLGLEYQQAPEALSSDIYSELFHKKRIKIVSMLSSTEGNNTEYIFYDLSGKRWGTLTSEGCLIKAAPQPIYDFLCIHQGILDKIKGSPDVIVSNIRNSNIARNIIITSGRGIPENLPENPIFLPFSSLENAFLDCKFSLTETLFSSKIYKGSNVNA